MADFLLFAVRNVGHGLETVLQPTGPCCRVALGVSGREGSRGDKLRVIHAVFRACLGHDMVLLQAPGLVFLTHRTASPAACVMSQLFVVRNLSRSTLQAALVDWTLALQPLWLSEAPSHGSRLWCLLLACLDGAHLPVVTSLCCTHRMQTQFS